MSRAAAAAAGVAVRLLIAFPVIGLLLGVFSSAAAIESSGPPAGGGGPPRPEPGPEPVPDSPGSGRLADAGAGTGGSTAGLRGWGEEGPDGVQGEVMAGLTGGAGLGAGAR
jgi:hypothetical protein